MDAATVMLEPPKHDWMDFADFSTAEVWDGVETAVVKRLQKEYPSLHHFRPVRVEVAVRSCTRRP